MHRRVRPPQLVFIWAIIRGLGKVNGEMNPDGEPDEMSNPRYDELKPTRVGYRPILCCMISLNDRGHIGEKRAGT